MPKTVGARFCAGLSQTRRQFELFFAFILKQLNSRHLGFWVFNNFFLSTHWCAVRARTSFGSRHLVGCDHLGVSFLRATN